MAAANKTDCLLAEANNVFGLNLHLELVKEQGNVFFSPFSISVALSMLLRGAKGKTASEMKRVLGFESVKLDDSQIHQSFKKLLDVIVKNQELCTLSVANAIVTQKDFAIFPDYVSELQEIYKAIAMEVDFATEASEAINKVNQWVNENTKGKIPTLLESLDAATVVILLNAVYFKGTWKYQFNSKNTYDGIFYNKGVQDQGKNAPLMYISKKFLFAEGEMYKALELPYEGDHIAMLSLLPNEIGGLKELEKSLTTDFLQEIRNELRKVEVDVTLPKLHLEYSKELLPILETLGISKLFQEGANLKGLSDSNQLKVSSVIHKAVVDVNEEGSEAAAVTADCLLAEANNVFGLNLHLELAKEQGNVFFSPFSISVALSMLLRGAKGETASEMKRVLGFESVKLDDSQIHQSFKKLLGVIVKNQELYTLSVANAIVTQKDFAIFPDYVSELQEIYKAIAMEVDFATEASEAINKVNQWVNDNTKGKIPTLLESLDAATVVILLNAVYFKGTWKYQFNPKKTYDGIFYNKGVQDQGKNVPLMYISKKFLFAEREMYKALELPYEGDHIAMLLLLPNEIGGLKELEKSLTTDFLQEIRNELRKVEVHVTLPKLHVEYFKELLPILESLGIRRLFQEGANLKGLSDSNQLKVSNIIHKAVVDVNEEGSEAAALTAENLLAEANNDFGLKIHSKLAEQGTNIFFSPFSLSVALTMLLRGAKGETADEIRQVLCFEANELSDEHIHLCFNQLFDVLRENQAFYTLSSANAIAVQKQFALLPDYKSDLQSLYKALVLEVDFAVESSAAVQQINLWVNENTKGKISNAFDSFDPSTVIVLLNAIYFKGRWKEQFDPYCTEDGLFYNKGLREQAKTVPLMRITKKFLFIECETYKALELPYDGNNIAMLLFLPHELGGLGDFEKKLACDFIQTTRKKLAEAKVEVTLPKLHLEYSKELSSILKALGMTKVFERGANLKGLSDCNELSVSKVIHKTVLDVNEEGSEAAAVTAVQINRRCLIINPLFNADHPFLFVIYDKRSNLILFMGHVEEL